MDGWSARRPPACPPTCPPARTPLTRPPSRADLKTSPPLASRYSDRIPFRERSETPDIAVELSLQPWRAFRPDGVIMFSDILTPLPALGVEFDVIKGKGPVIASPLRRRAGVGSWGGVGARRLPQPAPVLPGRRPPPPPLYLPSHDAVAALRPLDDPDAALPFIRPILAALRADVGPDAAVLGFVGAPWTLAAYAVEGKADKHCMATKTMMRRDPAMLKRILEHLAAAMGTYVVHQIDCGAQAVQIFDSWAHHLSPAQYAEFSAPYSEMVVAAAKAARPGVPIILHANGGTGKHALLAATGADVVGLDWGTDMGEARAVYGAGRVLQGNVDPMELFGPDAAIEAAVEACVRAAASGGAAGRHILNVGHGVAQGTPEEAVGLFCDLARRSGAWLPAARELAGV